MKHLIFCRSTNVSREEELLEKLKELAKESKNKGFNTQKFTELLKEYTNGSKNFYNKHF